MNVLSRVLHAAYNEAVKPKTFVRGDEFECFLRREVFPAARYDILRKTHGYTVNKDDFVESTKEPDFLFRDRASGREFYVEAKYRSGFYRQGVDWCKEYQLQRYRALDRETPVLVAVGVGGTASRPDSLYLFPVRGITYTRLFPRLLQRFEIHHGCVASGLLRQLLTGNEPETAVPAMA
jgi:hypothetical protein